MDYRFGSRSGPDCADRLEAHLRELRRMSHDYLAWDWDFSRTEHFDREGNKNIAVSIVFRPAVWPRISHPAAEYADSQIVVQKSGEQDPLPIENDES